MGALTPFNHPLNQVAHKLAPAIAVGAPIVVKPSEKTPLSALALVDLIREAGLPDAAAQVMLPGNPAEILERHARPRRGRGSSRSPAALASASRSPTASVTGAPYSNSAATTR